MYFYLTTAGMVLLAFFWGAGVAWLITPRQWRGCWPLLALPLGFALESAVVWAAGWLPLTGTDVYGRWSLVLPLLFLIAARWCARRRGEKTGWNQLRPVAGALALTLFVTLLAVQPWARGHWFGALTTISNGSCDAADYAAGARVFKEFSPQDRGGFLGQSEVAGILTVDNFHDHWRQLNHFTPAALVALNASILGRAVHELTGVICAVLLAALVPVTVLVARTVVRLRPPAALAVGAIMGLGAIQNYAVYQEAMGQMLAAAAVGILAWGGFQLLRVAGNWRRAWSWFGVLALAWWLLLGSYAFFIVVALAPLAGVAGWWIIQRGSGRRLAHALAVLGAAVLCASFFGWERMAGFALRWSLHDSVEYGWPIPRLLPDGWLGLVASAELQPVAAWWGWPVTGALVVAFVWPVWKLARRDSLWMWTVAGFVGPFVVGYAILSVKGSVPGSNASYDAYKLLACFQPVLLAGMLSWWRRLPGRWAIGVPLASVAAIWLAGSALRARAATRPLVVHAELIALGKLEERPAVHAINILCGEMWPRLWANAFLLRKEQHFAVPTYEGRRPGRLSGEWNLQDSLLRVWPLAADDLLLANRDFTVVRAGAPGLLRANFVDGWYGEERIGVSRWRWSDGHGEIQVINSTGAPVHAKMRLRVRAFRATQFTVRLESQAIGAQWLDGTVQDMAVDDFLVPTGSTLLVLAGEVATTEAVPSARQLSFALFELELHALAVEK